ncbi:MAG: hypothetical protein M1833_004738, partial [Piccolia ochrophora]
MANERFTPTVRKANRNHDEWIAKLVLKMLWFLRPERFAFQSNEVLPIPDMQKTI